jgi:hypothetical protein
VVCGNAGILMTAGNGAGEIDMDHGVMGFAQMGEEIFVIADAHGICGGDLSAAFHVGGNITCRDADTITIELVVFHDAQGNGGNVVLFQDAAGQIAGGIRCDLDHTIIAPHYVMRGLYHVHQRNAIELTEV